MFMTSEARGSRLSLVFPSCYVMSAFKLGVMRKRVSWKFGQPFSFQLGKDEGAFRWHHKLRPCYQIHVLIYVRTRAMVGMKAERLVVRIV